MYVGSEYILRVVVGEMSDDLLNLNEDTPRASKTSRSVLTSLP